MLPQVDLGAEVQVRVPVLFTQILSFSVIVLGLLYEGRYIAVPLSFLFVFEIMSTNTSFSNLFLIIVRELYKQLSKMHAYRQYQFSENHISSTGENAFPHYFHYLSRDLREISYRKSSHNIVEHS